MMSPKKDEKNILVFMAHIGLYASFKQAYQQFKNQVKFRT